MEYIGSLEYDTRLRNEAEKIIICGAGKRLEPLLSEFQILGIKNIICVCDNNITSTREDMDGIPICSLNTAFEKYRDADFVVYNRYAIEICRQLMDNGISKIHLLRR